MSVLFKLFVTCSRRVHTVNKVQIKYFARAITGDHITELNEKTLTGRLLIYLNNEGDYPEVRKTTDGLETLKKEVIRNLDKFDTPQIIFSLRLMQNQENFNNRFEFKNILNRIDNEMCKRLNQLDIKDKLKVLHLYMNIISNRITEYKFYNAVIEDLINICDTLTKNELVHLIFYIGLQKKSSKSQNMLKKCMKLLNDSFINSLTIEQICIICNSTFKTSTKITNKVFLDRVVKYVTDNLCLLKDPAIFITLIKTVRHNRYQNEDLLSTISCTVFFNKTVECYSFSALCHILAMYSDFLYFDENITRVFTKKCIELLKNSEYTSKHTYLEDQARVKDIKRLLWSLSNLNYEELEDKDIKMAIMPDLLKRIETGEFKDDVSDLVEIMLYLWMLGYHAYELVPYVLTKENIRTIKTSVSPTRSRLNLLLYLIYVEDNKLFRELGVSYPQEDKSYDMAKQIKSRPMLQKVLENLKINTAYQNINKFEVGCQVPFINIVGITGYQNKIYKAINVEVLDDWTTMKNTEGVPTGLMELKMRILNKLEEKLVLVSSELELEEEEII